MKLLLLGVLVNPRNISIHRGISPATNKWQFDFMNSFKGKDCEIRTLSYISEPYWPKGKLFPKTMLGDLNELNSLGSFTYLNIAGIRDFFIYMKMKKMVSRVSEQYAFDYLITFNSLRRNNMIGSFVQKVMKRKWLSIIGDGDINPQPDMVIIQNFLTYQNYKPNNKYLYEGGVPVVKKSDISFVKKNLVFTGTITALTGIEKFAEEFGQMHIDGLELDIYGRGDFSKLEEIAKKYQSINIYGFVSYDVLQDAMESAYAFINPRNESEEGNQNTFPSKVLEYISYGKPILSTDTKSFKEEFRNLLFTYRSDNLDSLREVLEKIRSFTVEDLVETKRKLITFAEKNSWEYISEKLLTELKKREHE